MLFNSFNFWLVFPVVFFLYWLIPSSLRKVKTGYLIAVSYLLYLNYTPVYALILLSITLVTFWGARAIENSPHKKILIYTFAIMALLPLGLFKYYDFIVSNVNELLTLAHLKFTIPGLNWAIPIGISFFSFQAIGYLFDVYYGKEKAERSITDYILFVSFFPQIASGPISKASELLPQIKKVRPFVYSQAREGLKLLLWGMFLKVVVADRLGLYVNIIYENYTHYSGFNIFIATILYSFQIYADFAGYSLMAIGIAKTLGFDLINNFQRPYCSISITDFWRRWHISLSRWLKDYVYIPLGGSRCGKLRNYYNILITFLVSGIWHGANWTFVVWGLLHGMAQIGEKHLSIQVLKDNRMAVRLARIFLTFAFINFTWVFFRMNTLEDACLLMQRIVFSFSEGNVLTQERTSIMVGLPILILKEVKDEFFSDKFTFLNSMIMRWLVYLFLFTLIIFIGVLDSGQFIYVKF